MANVNVGYDSGGSTTKRSVVQQSAYDMAQLKAKEAAAKKRAEEEAERAEKARVEAERAAKASEAARQVKAREADAKAKAEAKAKEVAAAKVAEAKADAAKAKAEAKAKADAKAKAEATAQAKASAAKNTATNTAKNTATKTATTKTVADTKKQEPAKTGTIFDMASKLTEKALSGIGGDRQAYGGQILNDLTTDVTTGVDSTAGEVLDLYTQAINAGVPSGGNYNYNTVPTLAYDKPTLKSAKELAELYGLNYDQNYIYNMLMKSVDEGHRLRAIDQTLAADQYYDNVATAQNTLTDTLANQQSLAIMNGVNKGMQAANMLSAVLGTSQQFAGNATQLAQDRAKLSQEYATQKAKTGADALSTYNAMGADLGELSKSLYSSDVSKYVGQLDYNTGVNTVNGQLGAQQMAAESQWDTNMANAIAGVYDSYLKGQISLEEAKQQAAVARYSADQSYKATQYNADKNYDASLYNSNQNYNASVYSASKNYDASVYSASKNYDANVYNTNANLSATKASQQQAIAGGLMDNITSGIYTAEQGAKMLDTYRATGQISQDVYNATLPYVESLQPVPSQLDKTLSGISDGLAHALGTTLGKVAKKVTKK